jgi:hypothetical protein
VSDFNKIIRNLPAVLLVMGGLLLMSRYSEAFRQQARTSRPLRLIGSGCLAALCLMAGSMFVLTPFTVFNIFYQQPVLVGGFLAILAATGWPGLKGQRLLYGLFFLALLQVSIRAIGISTWGVWCARDVSYTQATTRINQELDTLSAGEIIFASGAHLYGIANRTNITWLHANWPLPTNLANWQITALEHHHPAKLILTPIDYYMTYEPALRQMQQTRSDVQIRIITLTKIPPPEATPLTGKLLQYLSWAPIIVDISWPERPVKELHTQ